ncbi:MAG: 2-isopropylmalate synthase [Bacteroidales bacterium]|nr:2-isopropylmalate synthase [Bacteroidales bacterium]
MKIEIMDTTLRDGEQTSGVSFTEKEKFTIAKQLLTEINVDRIEIASARVSTGEFSSVKKIMTWALERCFIERIEVLGFVDEIQSVDWISQTGGRCMNLLTKGSLNHLTNQLKKTPEQHFNDIRRVIAYANSKGINVNVYLEDWSNGMKTSPEYIRQYLQTLQTENIRRFMLPDTLGILNPDEVTLFCGSLRREFPDLHFDFHGHNDYDMAVANALAAVKAGVNGIHTSINGLGERTGNTTLSSVVPALNDHVPGIEISVNEASLNKTSKMVEIISGLRIPENKPVIGENVFTQTAGVHADGDKKGNLYFNRLMPERFGRVRKYALGKTSGKANIEKNLEELGIELEPEIMQKVTQKVIELGDKKETITTEDLPYIIREVIGDKQTQEEIIITNYFLGKAKGLKPVATVKLHYKGVDYEETAKGDGQYDAYMNAIKKIYTNHIPRTLPILIDYLVTIPPGGKTDALVETSITWRLGEKDFKTRGLDSDQTTAAIIATTRMLNIIEEGFMNDK